MNRREFLKISGLGLAGMTMPGLNIPILSPRKALACDSSTTWKFGVMADTQWSTGFGVVEPASCATTIIDILNDQFIQHGCKFVVQVGDMVDKEVIDGQRTLPTRADHATALYDAGIGFFPLRGNHEASAVAAGEFPILFPQTSGEGPNLFGATNVESPVLSVGYSDHDSLKGLTYMFDINNVRCVLIDQFVRADGSNYNNDDYYLNNAVDQIEWIDTVLSQNDLNRHSFVFAHKNLIGQNHKDNLFGLSLTDNATARDQFLNSLCNNGVRYFLSGHDHMHHFSTVKSGDLSSSVGQIICSSNSYKFYTPRSGDDGRETPLGQELYTIGYYIFTIDGPRVTVDFYSSSHGLDYGDVSLDAPPDDLIFFLRDSFGYSLNGYEFEVGQGESYAKVEDSHEGTKARILDGTNNNNATDLLGRPLSKVVNTGWTDTCQEDRVVSNIFSLWGMSGNLSLFKEELSGYLPDEDVSRETDVYTLSLSYDDHKVGYSHILSGSLCLAVKDGSRWVNAVDLNRGGTKKFRIGPWQPDFSLGTWGIDPLNDTVWAVINHEGDFAAKLT